MANFYQTWPENGEVTLTLGKTTVTTASKTVYAYGVYNAVATQLGTVAGAAAGTDLVITLDLAQLTTLDVDYDLEVVANPADANPVPLIPNNDYHPSAKFRLKGFVSIT